MSDGGGSGGDGAQGATIAQAGCSIDQGGGANPQRVLSFSAAVGQKIEFLRRILLMLWPERPVDVSVGHWGHQPTNVASGHKSTKYLQTERLLLH